MRPVAAKVTDTDAHRETDKAMTIGEIAYLLENVRSSAILCNVDV